MGGPLVQSILNCINLSQQDFVAAFEESLTPVIDVRVQRLMPGMYPSIPGWHCDSVPRATYTSQPDFKLLHPHSFHLTCLLSTSENVSNTEFLDEEISVEFDEDSAIWRQLHIAIENAGPLKKVVAAPGRVYKFDSLTPHRTMPCVERGWRLFFRLSMYHNPPIVNKVPAAQQVYLLSEENGW